MELKTEQIVEELRDIQSQVIDQMNRARKILHQLPREHKIIEDRAEAYWIAHIEQAADGSNPYDTSIATTIEEVEDILSEGVK